MSQELWRMNCKQLMEHDSVVEAKDVEVARMKASIAKLEAKDIEIARMEARIAKLEAGLKMSLSSLVDSQINPSPVGVSHCLGM